jgi:hypothetical protein
MKLLAFARRTATAVAALALIACVPALATDSAAAPAMDAITAARTYLEPLITPLAISGFCSFLSAILPQGEAGTVWGFMRKFLDAVALNVLNAKNAPK